MRQFQLSRSSASVGSLDHTSAIVVIAIASQAATAWRIAGPSVVAARDQSSALADPSCSGPSAA